MDIQQIIADVDHLALREEARLHWSKRTKLYTVTDAFNDLIIVGSVLAVIAVIVMASAHIITAFENNTSTAAANAAPWFTEIILILALWQRRNVGKLGLAMTILVVSMSFLANLFVGLDSAKDNDRYELFAYIVAAAIPLSTIYLGHRIPELLLARNFQARREEKWTEHAYEELKLIYTNAYTKRGMLAKVAVREGALQAKRYSPSPVTVSQKGDDQNEIKLLPPPKAQLLGDGLITPASGAVNDSGDASVMAVTPAVTPSLPRRCAITGCNNPVKEGQTYCSPAHRQKAYRQRTGG